MKRFAVLVGVLAAIAALAAPPTPGPNPYLAATGNWIVPGCSEIQCFRILVPWVLHLFPVSAALKWKVFAVLCNAAAGFAVFDLSLTLGLTKRVAGYALVLSAFGFGSLYTLFETFTADPLMFWLAPLVTKWLLEDRIAWPALVSCVGVFGKEFVVIAVATVGVWAGCTRRWRLAGTCGAIAGAGFTAWAALQIALIYFSGYSYSGAGTEPARKLLSGSYLALWLSRMPPSDAVVAMFNEFGALYLLTPVGWLAAPRALKQLALAALPFAAFLAYVEQPDRALWNFNFLATPLAAIVLADVPAALAGTFVALYATANLRVGAQVPYAPPARFALAASIVVALIAIVLHWRVRNGGPSPATA